MRRKKHVPRPIEICFDNFFNFSIFFEMWAKFSSNWLMKKYQQNDYIRWVFTLCLFIKWKTHLNWNSLSSIWRYFSLSKWRKKLTERDYQMKFINQTVTFNGFFSFTDFIASLFMQKTGCASAERKQKFPSHSVSHKSDQKLHSKNWMNVRRFQFNWPQWIRLFLIADFQISQEFIIYIQFESISIQSSIVNVNRKYWWKYEEYVDQSSFCVCCIMCPLHWSLSPLSGRSLST